jgi:hypothetical protein
MSPSRPDRLDRLDRRVGARAEHRHHRPVVPPAAADQPALGRLGEMPRRRRDAGRRQRAQRRRAVLGGEIRDPVEKAVKVVAGPATSAASAKIGMLVEPRRARPRPPARPRASAPSGRRPARAAPAGNRRSARCPARCRRPRAPRAPPAPGPRVDPGHVADPAEVEEGQRLVRPDPARRRSGRTAPAAPPRRRSPRPPPGSPRPPAARSRGQQRPARLMRAPPARIMRKGLAVKAKRPRPREAACQNLGMRRAHHFASTGAAPDRRASGRARAQHRPLVGRVGAKVEGPEGRDRLAVGLDHRGVDPVERGARHHPQRPQIVRPSASSLRSEAIERPHPRKDTP